MARTSWIWSRKNKKPLKSSEQKKKIDADVDAVGRKFLEQKLLEIKASYGPNPTTQQCEEMKNKMRNFV